MVQAFAAGHACPLDDVRVLDLSRLLAGNMTTHILADLGADVIKVEPPEGDSLRAWRAGGTAVQWKVYGRNKRSIALDLKADDDRAIFRDLVSSADILVENFRPGVLDRLGFTMTELLTLQPRLVVLRISGWGQTGSYRNRPGFGTLVEAASGFAHKNGFPDRPPLLPNLGLADSIAGLYGAIAALVALRAAEVGGASGQEIDISLLESILSILGADQGVLRATGQVPGRTGNRTQISAPRNVYGTLDGKYVALSAATPEMAFRLFRAIDRPDLVDDPRFRTNDARLENVEALDGIIGEFIGARSLGDNLDLFHREQVTVGPIYDAAELMADPHVLERESIVEMPDADIGSLPMHNVVARLAGTPGAIRRAAPDLDADRAEILADLARRRGQVAP